MRSSNKIAAHQPFYLPDYYFFYKIFHADIFIIADFLKYRKQSAMSRTHLGKSFKPGFLSVPVQHQGNISLLSSARVKLINKKEWANRHLRTINSLCHKYPFFEHLFPDLEKIYMNNHIYLGDFLTDLILWQTNIIFPGKKIYVASREKIFSIGELKHWINRKFPEYRMYYYSPEYPYYQRYFNSSVLMMLNDQIRMQFPLDYEPFMPVLMLLFMVGPDVVLYFSLSQGKP
jgi:hypothetical protein